MAENSQQGKWKSSGFRIGSAIVGACAVLMAGIYLYQANTLSPEMMNTEVSNLLSESKIEEARKYLQEIQGTIEKTNKVELKAEYHLQKGLVDFEPMTVNKKFADPYKALLFLRSCREQIAQAKRLLVSSDPSDSMVARQRLRIEAAFLKLNHFETAYLQEGRRIEVSSQISRSISAPKAGFLNFHPAPAEAKKNKK